jgi:hypothetical protein
MNGNARPRLLSDLFAQVVEQRSDLEAFLSEALVIRQRESKVAGTDDATRS